MEYGICHLSSVPGRSEASDKAEMVTQLLFGDHFKIVDKRKGWKKVRNAYDKYECWIDEKQFIPISEDTYKSLDTYKDSVVALEMADVISHGDSNMTPILLGSTIPHFKDGTTKLEDHEWQYGGETKPLDWKADKSVIQQFAFMYLNAPYLWGGRSPFGIDCSGYAQIVYKLAGKRIPRDASQQAELGQTLSFIEEAEPGDLAFFDNDEGDIIHVGIVLPDNHIIHASGKVRIDRIDHQGIYNPEIRDYSHKLRIIKKII